MRSDLLRSTAVALSLASPPVLAEEPVPCRAGFDYSVSREAASPGEAFDLYGNWGPSQLDRVPDLVTGGAMTGGAGRLVVLEWGPTRVQVRVGRQVVPGVYTLSVFCGPNLSGVSPFKFFTVLEPNPYFEYRLSADSVRAGETLELFGRWRVLLDRRPTLIYNRGRERLPLEVTSWTEDVIEVRFPVLVGGEELVDASPLSATLFVDSEAPHLMAGYRPVTVLPPSREALRGAQIDAGLAAPWITDSPGRQAVVAALVFLLGSIVLGIRGMAVAASDMVLAAVFLVTWIWPLTFDFADFESLGALVALEFIVIHASAFLAAFSFLDTTISRRAAIVFGLSLLYTMFVWGISIAVDDRWPLVLFWTLMSVKLVPLFFISSELDRGLVLGRAALGTVIYVLATFAALVLPLPAFGWAGAVASGSFMEEAPHRLLFLGAAYFALAGLAEAYVARWQREPPVHIDD